MWDYDDHKRQNRSFERPLWVCIIITMIFREGQEYGHDQPLVDF